MITQILIMQTISMFVLMIIGLLLSKAGLLTERGSRDIGNILLYIVIPCVVIRSYVTEYTSQKLYGLLISAFLAVISFVVAIGVAYLTYGMKKPVENFGTAFCNAGFIGIPLITAIFGSEAAFYVASFASLLNLLQWTYGVVIISGKKQPIDLKKIMINPVSIALLIGLILFFARIQVPEIINDIMQSAADMNTPGAMIVLGYYLSCTGFRQLFQEKSFYFAALIRLLLIPGVTLLILYLIPWGHGETGMITLIAAATPIGTSTAIFAQKFGQDYQRAVCMICLSTILSIVSMPLVISVAEKILM